MPHGSGPASRGSRSAGSTRRTRATWSTPAPSAWWWCARSATQPTRPPRPPTCAASWTLRSGWLGKRSRKQRAPKPKPAPAPKPPSRSEIKNAEARAALKPLGPGERPLAVTIGAVVTFLAATVNLGYYIAGQKIHGERPALVGILFFTGLMYAMTWGLWHARYWAVLGLECLLGFILVFFSLFALRLESVRDLLISVGILVPSGALFWFLIKAMARIQMPERPGAR